MVRNCPVEFAALEVLHALLLHAVGDADVHAVGSEYTMNFWEHLSRVWAWTVSAKNRVEGALVDNCVKRSILVSQLAHIHLLVDEGWVALFVLLCHLLLHDERDVNVADALVTILAHLLRKTYIAL